VIPSANTASLLQILIEILSTVVANSILSHFLLGIKQKLLLDFNPIGSPTELTHLRSLLGLEW